jgi:hypothetical protein
MLLTVKKRSVGGGHVVDSREGRPAAATYWTTRKMSCFEQKKAACYHNHEALRAAFARELQDSRSSYRWHHHHRQSENAMHCISSTNPARPPLRTTRK